MSQSLLLGPSLFFEERKMERRQAKVEQQDEVGEGNRNLRESRKQAKVEKVGKI